MKSVLKYLPLAIGLALFASWLLLLRPVALGGPASYVVVSGTSMQPTLQPGDLIVTRQRAAYNVQDVVVYGIPEGQPGAGSDAAIVHRIVGGSDRQGFVVQGDNLPRRDPWTPSNEDIVGSLWLHAPGAGRYLVWILSPAVIGSVAGGLTVFIMMRRPEKKAVQPVTS